MKNMIILLVLTAAFANAAEVALYIEFPDGSAKSKCIVVEDGTSAAKTIGYVDWFSLKDFGWGHAVCNIDGVGCPTSDCFCGGWEFWNFWVNRRMSHVGIDGYAVSEGDVLGFTWGFWGSDPPGYKNFRDVCPIETGVKDKRKVEFDFGTSIEANKTYSIRVHREGEVKIAEPLANVEVLPKDRMSEWGFRRGKDLGQVFRGITDFQGNIDINIPATGAYVMVVHKAGVEQVNWTVNVVEKITATTTTSTTTTTTTTTLFSGGRPFKTTSWWMPGWYDY
ncbi:MAG TPA: hypothetical protein ENN13_03500 [Candidatus Altiarchaeales archaeon]|nr:hypothetical protein [Candidatus Altiarchaeales archaeon]